MRPAGPPRRNLRPGSLRPPPPAAQVQHKGHVLLGEARACADRGALDDAQRACERALIQAPRSPEAHSLLGVVRRARGDLSAARTSFLMALQLDPGHFETLIHMALLAEHDGDDAAARAYRARAASAERTTSP